jgi:hypothetical protein
MYMEELNTDNMYHNSSLILSLPSAKKKSLQELIRMQTARLSSEEDVF